MNIIGIIKDAFLFPSKNTGRFAIYLLLSVLMIGFALGGILTNAFGILDAENYLTGGIYLIISLLFGFIITGYHIKIVKSGIEQDDKVPPFEFYKDFMTGFDNLVVFIFYLLIPTLLVALVSLDTNLFGNAAAILHAVILQAYNVYFVGESMSIAVASLSPLIANFMNSLAITLTAASVLFVIFSILELIAEARLAHTGSIREALNIFETIKDIRRIGVLKVILLIVSIGLIISIIEFVLLSVLGYYPFLLSIIIIIITPYLLLVTQRALGLLYSDIT